MARIAGVNIPVQKHTLIGLQSVYGIGKARALLICKEAKINPEKKLKIYPILSLTLYAVKWVSF